jgi:putative ABC transport system ATP-binding protein
MSVAIECKQLNHQVNLDNQTLSILKNINLSVISGQSIAIVGESGSGKSSLIGMLAGLDIPSSGNIDIFSKNICAMNEEQRAQVRAEHIGFIFQNFQLLPNLTALENVMLPLEIKGLTGNKQQALDILHKVGLSHRLQHYPKQLSGGEQQRVAIARAFVCKVNILFADEPTGNLDTKTGQLIEDLLFELNAQYNTTLILVTHDKTLASRCDQQIELSAGQIV